MTSASLAGKRRGIFYELRFRLNASKTGIVEILKDLLRSLGVKEQGIVELLQGKRLYLSVYFKSLSQAKTLGERLRRLHVRQVAVEIRPLKERDWQELWKTDFKPFPIGEKFVVTPPWLKKKYSPRTRIPIYIDTSLAFGSGLHETTRFMIELIERCEGRFTDFLDIGTGTGILSIAARRCGAERVQAMDSHPDCVRIAKSNFKENGYPASGVITADIHDYRTKERYDLVAANLVTHNLVKAGRTLVALVRPGKYLAVSGISLENMSRFRQAYKKYPLRCLKVIQGKSWAAFLYQKYSRSSR